MKSYKIVIIEDEELIREELKTLLVNAGYVVDCVINFAKTIDYIKSAFPDLILLDINLPEQDGYRLCSSIRSFSTTPILFITGRNTTMDEFNLRMKDTSEDQEDVKISFWEVFDEFVKECGNQNNWTESTYEKFAAVKNHLKEFKEDVTFEYFDEFGLNEYVNFLRDKKDMRNSTIGKQMGFLKWFLRWSFKKGYNQNIVYDTFKPKLKTTSKKVIFLTWDELNKLKDYQIPKDKQYLERVRDVFLFCCFTSLRYSDVRNLKRSDVKSDHIEVTTVKTADSLSIELNKYSKAILEKYKDIHFENHMALPVISNQKMNDYLKELGELAEINEPIRETYYKGNERIDEVTPKYALLSTHAGRRTFICNALALGIPAPVVMKWTGHSDYKAMKPYIDIADDIKANAMNKFNQL